MLVDTYRTGWQYNEPCPNRQMHAINSDGCKHCPYYGGQINADRGEATAPVRIRCTYINPNWDEARYANNKLEYIDSLMQETQAVWKFERDQTGANPTLTPNELLAKYRAKVGGTPIVLSKLCTRDDWKWRGREVGDHEHGYMFWHVDYSKAILMDEREVVFLYDYEQTREYHKPEIPTPNNPIQLTINFE